jgi:hypothetical protein
MVRRIGWNPGGLVDLLGAGVAVGAADGSAIATLVGYGCHTVCTPPLLAYAPDYRGLCAISSVRSPEECIFFQGAGGNVMPRIAFDQSGQEASRLGQRLAIEALHAWSTDPLLRAASSAPPSPRRTRSTSSGSSPSRAASRARCRRRDGRLPLLPLPSPEVVEEELAKAEAELRAAMESGADDGELRVLRYFGVNHWRRVQAEHASGSPRTSVSGSICAVRIGDGAIVSGPGEIFTEIGMAVKERSPADVTLYAGYTNGAVSYMPIAAEYPLGGYEPGYGNKSYGLPAQVAPATERILVETGALLVRSLFPSGASGRGLARDRAQPDPLPPVRFTRPA